MTLSPAARATCAEPCVCACVCVFVFVCERAWGGERVSLRTPSQWRKTETPFHIVFFFVCERERESVCVYLELGAQQRVVLLEVSPPLRMAQNDPAASCACARARPFVIMMMMMMMQIACASPCSACVLCFVESDEGTESDKGEWASKVSGARRAQGCAGRARGNQSQQRDERKTERDEE